MLKTNATQRVPGVSRQKIMTPPSTMLQVCSTSLPVTSDRSRSSTSSKLTVHRQSTVPISLHPDKPNNTLQQYSVFTIGLSCSNKQGKSRQTTKLSCFHVHDHKQGLKNSVFLFCIFHHWLIFHLAPHIAHSNNGSGSNFFNRASSCR